LPTGKGPGHAGEKIASAHPVSDEMRATILQDAARYRVARGRRGAVRLRIGSRGWGFASPDSEYDVRFVYVRRLPSYLTLEPVRDVIEQPISGELDINGWDLRKALQLLRDSNPTLLEWLRSPIVYAQHEAFAHAPARARRERLFARARLPPLRLDGEEEPARAPVGERGAPQEVLYVLRPLLAARWIREQRGTPPMRFAELARGRRWTIRPLIAEINALLEVKMRTGEAARARAATVLHAFIERELETAQASVIVESHRIDTRELDRFLCERCCATRTSRPRTEGGGLGVARAAGARVSILAGQRIVSPAALHVEAVEEAVAEEHEIHRGLGDARLHVVDLDVADAHGVEHRDVAADHAIGGAHRPTAAIAIFTPRRVASLALIET
jgi:predicted nucleotidyltransferase